MAGYYAMGNGSNRLLILLGFLPKAEGPAPRASHSTCYAPI
jgi:hypothetical protein